MPYKVGHLLLDIKASEEGITSIHFITPSQETSVSQSDNPLIQQCLDEIDQFLNKKITTFSIPLDIQTGTEFEKSVWSALLEIPYGQTSSYKDIAIQINHPRAYQAVGQACKKNPIPIVIPCHRVISRSGKLTGYFGASEYGLTIKHSLLALEKGNQ